MSKKFSAADLIAITAWPGSATGSGTSASTRSSGWQYCEQRMAFMDTPDFRTHKEGWMLLAGFEAGLQSDSDASAPHAGLPSVIASEAKQSMAYQGLDCFVADAPRNDGA